MGNFIGIPFGAFLVDRLGYRKTLLINYVLIVPFIGKYPRWTEDFEAEPPSKLSLCLLRIGACYLPVESSAVYLGEFSESIVIVPACLVSA